MSRNPEIGKPPACATDVVVIGAGQAGLSASYLLREEGIDHVVLERGEVGNAWRTERWDSLRLLTPNWQTKLPGYAYRGDDPNGFMNTAALVTFLEDYAALAQAPIRTGTTVTSLQHDGERFVVQTSAGNWTARSVVIASGACNLASRPVLAAEVPDSIQQLTARDYRSTASVADGGVLVVGASATGMQLADELLAAGHPVTLAVGEHVRMPRRYRGRDIFYWMDRCGILNERYDEIDDIVRGRGLPSAQLVGSADRPILDLNALREQGAQIRGRLMGVRDGTAQFSGSLRNVCALADLKMRRLLKLIDDSIADAAPAETFADTVVDEQPQLTMNLADASIGTIIWATGYRPDYSWLDLPVLDRKGRLRHDGGIVDFPGVYALGLPLMRRRKSSFIYGVEDDARDITEHLAAFLRQHRSSKNDRPHSAVVAP